MTGEIIFMAILAIAAGVVIWRSVKRKSKKSCCE